MSTQPTPDKSRNRKLGLRELHLSDNGCRLRRSTQHLPEGPPLRAISLAHRRSGSIQASCNLTKRQSRSDPSRNILSLRQLSERRERRRAAGAMPPRGTSKHRIELWGLSKARPISCSDCPDFQRLQILLFSTSENPNRFPGLIQHHL
jgi:hypothetical protein